MKSFVAVLALIALASADVSHLSNAAARSAQILKADLDVRPDGYQSAFETSNGIVAQESGNLKNAGRPDEAWEVQGNTQYIGPDGTPVKLTFTANEYGYQPQGSHLPTPPPTQAIPEYILRSIEFNNAHPNSEYQN